MPFFRKNIEFKVVKSQEKEEAKASSEPEIKPKEVEKETLDVAELEKLRGQWRTALEEGWLIGSRDNIRLFTIQGVQRFFYSVKTLQRSAKPGVSEEKCIAINEGLAPVELTATYRWNHAGVRVDAEEKPVDASSVGLDPEKIAALVKRVVGGEFY